MVVVVLVVLATMTPDAIMEETRDVIAAAAVSPPHPRAVVRY